MRKKRKADGSFVEDSDVDEAKLPLRTVSTSAKPRQPAVKEQKKSTVTTSTIAILEDADARSGAEIRDKAFTTAIRKAANEAILMGHKHRLTGAVAAVLTPQVIAYINRNASPAIIHNVVAKAELKTKFVVYELAMKLNGLHNRQKFSAPVCLAMLCPRVTALIFSTGTVVVVGAKSDAIAKLALYRVSGYITDRTGVIVQPHNITVNNIMATVYLGYRVDLDRVCAAFIQNDGKPPAIVFGAVKLYVDGGAVMLFSSGKFVICGPRDTSELQRIREELIVQLAAFHDGDMDAEEMEARRLRQEEAMRKDNERQRIETEKRKLRTKIEAGKRGLRHKFPDAALEKLVDLEAIDIGECLPPIGEKSKATKSRKPLPVPTVAAINTTKEVCRHRLSVRYHNAPTKEMHKIGFVGSHWIIKLHRQNGLPVPDHFSKPPPPVQKRRGSSKNPNGDDGEYHQIEGVSYRFDFAGVVDPPKNRSSKKAAAAAPAAAK